MTHTTLLLTMLLALGILTPMPASAQDVSLSEVQVELNQRGVIAIQNEEYEDAVELFQASLSLGPADLTYLNLGRALALLGRCREAREAYDKVSTAPHVRGLSNSELDAALARYLEEFPEQCEGLLLLSCSPPSLEARVDDGPWQPCQDASPVTLLAGEHSVSGRLKEQTTERFEVEILGGEAGEQALHITPMGQLVLHCTPSEMEIRIDEGEWQACTQAPHVLEAGAHEVRGRLDSDLTQARVEVEPGQTASRLLQIDTGLSLTSGGIIVGSVGLALLATYVGLELGVLEPDIEDFRKAAALGDRETYDRLYDSIGTTQAINQTLFITGGLAVLGGGLMILLDQILPADSDATPTPVGLWLDSSGAGVTWSGAW